ncbi:MAG TPA: hypothetical protein PKO22_00730 [Treponemataceae bacterium]|nr:hypothetical protein [Treponemataceae bacterium]
MANGRYLTAFQSNSIRIGTNFPADKNKTKEDDDSTEKNAARADQRSRLARKATGTIKEFFIGTDYHASDWKTRLFYTA